MASQDLHHAVSVAPAFTPRIINSDAATAGSIVDTNGYNSLEFVIASGTLTDGAYTPMLEAGDAANLSDAVEVTAALGLLGTIAAATFAATDDNKTKRLGYVGGRRYVRLTITSATTTTGGLLGAVAVLGHPWIVPTE